MEKLQRPVDQAGFLYQIVYYNRLLCIQFETLTTLSVHWCDKVSSGKKVESCSIFAARQHHLARSCASQSYIWKCTFLVDYFVTAFLSHQCSAHSLAACLLPHHSSESYAVLAAFTFWFLKLRNQLKITSCGRDRFSSCSSHWSVLQPHYFCLPKKVVSAQRFELSSSFNQGYQRW